MSFVSPGLQDMVTNASRRTFLEQSCGGIGLLALHSLLSPSRASGANLDPARGADALQKVLPHFAPRAKRVICLFQSGGVSHVDLFEREAGGSEICRSGNSAFRQRGTAADRHDLRSERLPGRSPIENGETLRTGGGLDQ